MVVQGLGQALQPVEAVRVLLADHDGADAGLPLDELLAAQQVEGLPDGVAAGAVVGGDDVLQREDAARESARQDLVAQQISELPGLVRTQPPTARGGDRKRGGDTFGWHGRERTGAAAPMVLRQYCAT